MTSRMPRYLKRELWITLGFAALFAALIVLGEHAKGWNGLTYLLFALGAAALWMLVSAVYMVGIIVRERAGRAARPAMAVLAGVVLLAVLFALWMGR